MIYKCKTCGKIFDSKDKTRVNCSNKCFYIYKSKKYAGKGNPFYGRKHSKGTSQKMSKAKKGKYCGENNHFWKGGKRISYDGYVLIYAPHKPYRYIKEHRLVMEKIIGRPLYSHESVHHINGIKTDNRLENLILFTNESEHQKYHFLNVHK